MEMKIILPWMTAYIYFFFVNTTHVMNIMDVRTTQEKATNFA
jgi:hypothetical protein